MLWHLSCDVSLVLSVLCHLSLLAAYFDEADANKSPPRHMSSKSALSHMSCAPEQRHVFIPRKLTSFSFTHTHTHIHTDC